jgi:hypothetical protein
MSHVVLESPTLLFLILFLPILFLLHRLAGDRNIPFRRIFFLCGGFCIGVFAFINIANIFRPGVFWHDEAHILVVAAAYLKGEPMYPAFTAPDFYALVYGPLTYLVYVPFLAGFQHPIAAMRVGTLAVNLANLALIFLILRERLSRSAALALLSLAIVPLLSMSPVLLGTRGDSWLLFCFSLAVFSTLRRNWIVAAMVSGILGALAIDFKPTVVPVVCLMLAMVYRRHGLRALLTAGFTSVACVLALFRLPGISLSNYLGWLVLSSHRRIINQTLMDTLMAAILLLLPIVFLVVFGSRPERRREFGLILPILCGFALVTCVITGSKDGAGVWHLWPMLPFMLLWTAHEASLRGVDSQSSSSVISNENDSVARPASTRTLCVVAAIALAATLVTLRYGFRDIRIVHAQDQAQQRVAQRAALNAIDTLTSRSFSGHNLAMGYGTDSGDYRSSLRFELSLERQEYFFDENAFIEGFKEGLPIPASVVQRILGCKDIWLIPHGDVPFSTLKAGVLPIVDTPYLFPDMIRLHFTQSHTLLESGDIYDLWGCSYAAQP